MNNDKNIISFRASDGNTVRLECWESLPSTQELATEYAKAGYPDRYAIFTEKQTAISATGAPLSSGEVEKGLFITCILRPSIFPAQSGCIRFLGAVALASALEEHTMKNVGIGWMSDIFCDGVKIGLCDTRSTPEDSTGYHFFIVNMWVKLDKKFSPRLTDMVRRVFEDGNQSISIIMAKTILNRFFAVYKDVKNPAKHINHYMNRFVLAGKKIKYIEDGKKKTVKVVGVNKENLSLLIETRDGRQININSQSSVIIPNKI